MALVLLGPLYLGSFYSQLLALAVLYGLFAFGLDLAWGRAGIVSLGQAVFFGFGAYGVAIAADRGASTLLGAALGVAAATALAAAVGAIGLRRATNPSTMAVLTLVLTLLAERAATAWTNVTGGSNGLFVAAPASLDSYIWICLAVSVGIVLAVWLGLLRRRLGNRWLAIGLNDQRAEHLGIPVHRSRVAAFALGGLVSAVAGALAAPLLSSVSPDRVGILLSTQVMVWLVIGGRATLIGPFVGAVAATFGEDALASSLADSYLLLLGVLFVTCVLVLPRGLAGVLGPRWRAANTVSLKPTRRDAAADADGCVLVAEGVEKRFDGVRAVSHADLHVADAQIVCLIGPNGAGKTTLLNILSGATPADAGTIRLCGRRIDRAAPFKRVRGGLGRTFQVSSLFDGLTVGEHLILARQEAGGTAPLPSVYERLEAAHADTAAGQLSLGDRRSLEIAMALCLRPRVLLLDEPSAGLDHGESSELAATLREVRDHQGCAIVAVEHDMDIVRSLADRVVCLHDGEVIAEGTMDELAQHGAVRSAYLGEAVA